MKNKRILIISISVIFAIILAFVGFFTFTVRTVDVDFDLYNGSESKGVELKIKLDQYKGRNLMFVSENEIIELIESDPYFEVKSITKNYPDGIKVSITERREVYLLNYDAKQYLLTEDGKVLCEFLGTDTSKYLKLEISDLTVNSCEIGQKLKCVESQELDNAFEIAKTVNLNDCVNEISVQRTPTTDITKPIGSKDTVIVFKTKTNVSITIRNADSRGIEKAQEVFKKFDEISDYNKSYYQLEVFEEIDTITGDKNIKVVWTKNGD